MLAAPSPAFKPPLALPGMRIGLLGGSFNPAHAGHRHISLHAMARAGLNRVWWVVTPGNPLKSHSELAALDMRLRLADAVADHRRIDVTGFEVGLGSSFTAQTLAYLNTRFREVRFVWLMGADNLAQFHQWKNWRRIVATLPLIVIDRPGWRYRALASPAGTFIAPYRVAAEDVLGLATMMSPAWAYLDIPLSPVSSTAIRHQDPELIE